MDILTIYAQLTPPEKKLIHMAFDDGTYEIIRMGPERLNSEGQEVFISVNHIESPEFEVHETKNHWTVGRVLT